MIKIQIKSVTGKLLFEYTKKNNTVKETLYEADLSEADLSVADNKEKSFMPIYCKWEMSIKDGVIKLGCKEKSLKDWKKWFDSNEEFETPRDTDEFKQILACFKAYEAYYNHLK